MEQKFNEHLSERKTVRGKKLSIYEGKPFMNSAFPVNYLIPFTIFKVSLSISPTRM